MLDTDPVTGRTFVWILFSYTQRGHEDVWGVFATRELAVAAQEEAERHDLAQGATAGFFIHGFMVRES